VVRGGGQPCFFQKPGGPGGIILAGRIPSKLIPPRGGGRVRSGPSPPGGRFRPSANNWGVTLAPKGRLHGGGRFPTQTNPGHLEETQNQGKGGGIIGGRGRVGHPKVAKRKRRTSPTGGGGSWVAEPLRRGKQQGRGSGAPPPGLHLDRAGRGEMLGGPTTSGTATPIGLGRPRGGLKSVRGGTCIHRGEFGSALHPGRAASRSKGTPGQGRLGRPPVNGRK